MQTDEKTVSFVYPPDRSFWEGVLFSVMSIESSEAKKSSVAGHRQRLRARFLAGETEALSELALLELLLTFAIPRREVKPIAQMLLDRFGSLNAVLAADASELMQVNGISEASATLIKLVGHLAAPQPDPAPGQQDAVPETVLPAKDLAPAAEDLPEESKSEDLPASHPGNTPVKGKLQVSASYSFDAAQMAALLTFIAERPHIRRFGRKDIIEGTGMPERQVEALVSMGAAMGLIVPVTQVLTPWGALVAKHDLFLDSIVSLEYCHYRAATNRANLIWFTVFNELLITAPPTDQPGWSTWLREKLAGQYSARSLVKHVANEVRFILDAYTVKAFKRLELIMQTPEQTLLLGRHASLSPQALAAAIYTFAGSYRAQVVPFDDLYATAGSPGRVFGLEAPLMRQMVENLHQKGWLRFEVRHGLDQVRLGQSLNPLEFLQAAYESREPEPQPATSNPGDSQAYLL